MVDMTLGQMLVNNPEAIVFIGGFTDRDDSDENNITLSKDRVQAGFDYLKNKFGIESDRISTSSYGENNADPNNTDPIDRRTEITVTDNPF